MNANDGGQYNRCCVFRWYLEDHIKVARCLSVIILASPTVADNADESETLTSTPLSTAIPPLARTAI